MTHNTHTNQQQHIHHKTTQNHRTHNTHTTAAAPSVAILDQGFECCCCANMTHSDSIFVGGLPGHMTKEQFEAIFSTFGTITSSYFMPARDPGAETSAWCRFSSIDEAIRVVEASCIMRLRVKFTASVAARGAASGAAAESGTPVVPGDLRRDIVFVSDLPGDMSKEQLKAIFSSYGVTSFRMMPEKTASGKAEALMNFSDIDDATWFEENLNDNIPEGLEQPIKCIFASRTPSYEPMRAWVCGARSQPYAAAGKKGMSCGSSGGEAMGGGCNGMSEGMRGGMSKGMSKCMSCGGYGYSGDMSKRQWRELFATATEVRDMGEGQSGGNIGGPSGSGYSGGMSQGQSKGMSGGMSQGMSEGQSGGKCGGGRPMISRDEAKKLINQWAVSFFETSRLQTKALEHLWDNLFDEPW